MVLPVWSNWWILQMCMGLAALFAIVMAAGMAYKMMVKNEPLDIMKLFKPLAISIILCWWYPPADTGMTNSGSNWCVLDFLSYIPNCIGSYTHDLYQAEATQIEDKFQEVQQLIYARDTMYTSLQAQADVAHSGTSDPNLIEATMEQTGVDEVTNMEKDAAKLWFTSLTSGIVVGIDKIVMLIALIVFRIGWWAISGQAQSVTPRQLSTTQNRALRFPTCRAYARSYPASVRAVLRLAVASCAVPAGCHVITVYDMFMADGGLWLPPSCTSADELELPDKRREEERDAAPVAKLSVFFPLVWQSTAAPPSSSSDGRLSETGVRTSPVCPLAAAEGLI